MPEFPTTPPIPRADIETLDAAEARRVSRAAVNPYVARHEITPLPPGDVTEWDVAATSVRASFTMDDDVDLFINNIEDGQTFCLFVETDGTGHILSLLTQIESVIATLLGEDELASIADLPDGSHFVLSGVANGNKVALFLKTFPAD